MGEEINLENLQSILLEQGASKVGFGRLEGLYNPCDLSLHTTVDSETKEFSIPEYPFGVSIAIALPKKIAKEIENKPTMEYYNAYYEINNRLDKLALDCEKYLVELGYEAYAQTVSRTKEYGIFTTIMPNKTVAVSAGLGWIGKSALLVTPEFGSAVRLTSVLTTAPLNCNEKILNTPCGGCDICKNACPGGAITGNVWEKDRNRDWIFDALKCRKMARKIAMDELQKEITMCGKCIAVCPYTKRYVN